MGTYCVLEGWTNDTRNILVLGTTLRVSSSRIVDAGEVDTSIFTLVVLGYLHESACRIEVYKRAKSTNCICY